MCPNSLINYYDELKKSLKRNGELLNGNTECDTLQIVPLVEAIHTNVVRLYISGFIGLEVFRNL